MPRHLISDAHEWITVIPTVPICNLVKPQSRERAWLERRGKKTLLSLTLIYHVKSIFWCKHFPAKILEWVAVPFCKGSSWSRDRTQGSYIAGRFFTVWATGKALINRFSDNIKEKNLWVMNSLWAHIEYTDFKLTSLDIFRMAINSVKSEIWNKFHDMVRSYG